MWANRARALRAGRERLGGNGLKARFAERNHGLPVEAFVADEAVGRVDQPVEAEDQAL
jgi:hypothetical protein